LRGALQTHHGIVSHYAGDALFAVWELRLFPDAAEHAIDFALAADRLVGEIGPALSVRNADGTPIRMGWAVVRGMAAVAAMTRSADAVIGDAANVAFRLSGVAGREGRRAVMVMGDVRQVVGGQFVWGEPEQVELKGRHGTETVYPVVARTTW
jgi:class 3 adenylate cyclase